MTQDVFPVSLLTEEIFFFSVCMFFFFVVVVFDVVVVFMPISKSRTGPSLQPRSPGVHADMYAPVCCLSFQRCAGAANAP